MHRLVAILAILCLSACSADSNSATDSPPRTRLLGNGIFGGTSGKPADVQNAAIGSAGSTSVSGFVEYGQPQSSEASGNAPPIMIEPGGKRVTLSFVDADASDFVRSVFDEVVREPVIIDPTITGKINLQSGEPVDRSGAVEIVRQMLEMNGAELRKEGTVWKATARPGGAARPGGSARIIPLRNADAEQTRAALQGLSNGTVAVAALPGGRAIVLTGAPQDVDPLVQLASSLDVDRMRGQSFALLPLREASAVAVAKELSQVFAAASRSFQVIPVQRMNAVLVISDRVELVARARQWVMRLDRELPNSGRLFVYPIQNRRAADLATVLRGMFGAKGSEGGANAAAPTSPGLDTISTASVSDPNAQPTGTVEPSQMLAAAFQATGPTPAEAPIAIQADVATNSLVVTASPQQWRMISAAIARLDVQPTQVLIEATIAEVQLNNELRHGVRWFFESGNHGVRLSGTETGSVLPTYPGISYVFNVPSARVVLSALEQVTDVEVVSSPALTVLDNETATLKVGDQVPIATRSARSTIDPNAPVVNDIELKDTGVILSVTPRVNASGLVQLDISQEVSDVVKTTTSNIDSPTIRQRKIDSSVSVGSGSEIVLGGLIGNRREKGESGVPFLMDIPFLGNAFKSDAGTARSRSELLIILRPTVMGTRADVEAVTQAVRAGMNGAARQFR